MRFLKGRDTLLDLLFLTALCLGLYSIFSISTGYFKFQFVFVITSVLIYVALNFLSKQIIKYSIFVGYLAMLLLLVYLYLFGDPNRGASSWLNIGTLALQPSEFVKISLVYIVSLIFSSVKLRVNQKFILLLLFFLPILVLTVLQPDIGTAISMLAGVSSVVFIATISKKQLFYVSILLITLLFLSFGFLQNYQKSRIQSFFSPQSDPLGSGYNVIQSEIAIGSGGVFGKGFKQNTQVTFKYLPESHTDFIFAAVSESFGMLYSSLLVVVIFSIGYRVLSKHIQKGKSTQNIYFATGFFALLFLHSALNIGMNLGLLPITGLPLPYISYGGSSLLTFSIFLGLVQRFQSD